MNPDTLVGPSFQMEPEALFPNINLATRVAGATGTVPFPASATRTRLRCCLQPMNEVLLYYLVSEFPLKFLMSEVPLHFIVSEVPLKFLMSEVTL